MLENEKLAKNHLDIMVGNFEQTDFKGEKKEVEERAKFIADQINFVQELNIVNIIAINEYLSRIEKKRIEELNKISQKEYKEQVVNFNDNVLAEQERLFLSRKKEGVFSLSEWKDSIGNNQNSTSGSSDKEVCIRNKEEERNREEY